MNINQTPVNILQRLRIIDCGLADYREILRTQYELRDKRKENLVPDTVLVVEHNPVITLGARKTANKLLTSIANLRKLGIDVVEIRRGGSSTAHNPGQLVFYPVLNIQKLHLPINSYIRQLESIGIELLEAFGVTGTAKKSFPGLWVEERKIASIGVRVSRFITYHGMAININNDLSIFDHIIPCGLDNVTMTSVFRETGKKIPMPEIKNKLYQLFLKYFSKEDMVEYEKLP